LKGLSSKSGRLRGEGEEFGYIKHFTSGENFEKKKNLKKKKKKKKQFAWGVSVASLPSQFSSLFACGKAFLF
jgi:hypothetical protein